MESVEEKEKQVEPESEPVHKCPPLVPQRHPWLVISHGKKRQRQTFYSISEDRYYPRVIPELSGRIISPSSFGWLACENDTNGDTYLWNPVSKKQIQLPSFFHYRVDYDSFILSSHPINDPNCHVAFINSCTGWVQSCQIGDNNYVLEWYQDRPMATTNFQGKLYGVTYRSYALVALEFDRHKTLVSRELGWQGDGLDLEPSWPDFSIYRVTYLVDFFGHLLLVEKLHRGYSEEVAYIHVFRVDFSKMVWEKVKSLGERAIFLDARRGMACFAPPDSGIRANCIYYVEPGDKNLYVFDLQELTISVSLPFPHVNRRLSMFHWVMMSPQDNL